METVPARQRKEDKMEICNVNAAENISSVQIAKDQMIDSVSKSIQNEISNIQRQKQELSSKEDISVEEKSKRRKELQQEIASLNMQLRQRKAEMRKEQRQKALLNEEINTEEKKNKDLESKDTNNKSSEIKDSDNKDTKVNNTENKDVEKSNAREKDLKEDTSMPNDIGMPNAEMHSILSMDAAMKQASSYGTVITRMEEGIVILKGEIKQDALLGTDVTKKQAQLTKQEEKLRNASASHITAAKSTKKANANTPIIRTVNFSKEKNSALVF